MATVTTPISSGLLTGADFAQMDISDTHELVRGRLTPMTPPPGFDHGSVEANIGGHLFIHLQSHKAGRVVTGDSGLYTTRNPDTVRGADLYFISNERLARRDKSLHYLDVAPEWITEVLSPSNTRAQVDEKLREYFAIGVRMVWLVDPEARCVHVYRSLTDIRTLHESDVITGEDILPGFQMQVAQIFENL